MKALASTLILSLVTLATAGAQSMNRMDNPVQQGPGTTGAMQRAPSNGVATDAAQVQQQQGRSVSASPGTVGAAPGADTRSQIPRR